MRVIQTSSFTHRRRWSQVLSNVCNIPLIRQRRPFLVFYRVISLWIVGRTIMLYQVNGPTYTITNLPHTHTHTSKPNKNENLVMNMHRNWSVNIQSLILWVCKHRPTCLAFGLVFTLSSDPYQSSLHAVSVTFPLHYIISFHRFTLRKIVCTLFVTVKFSLLGEFFRNMQMG